MRATRTKPAKEKNARLARRPAQDELDVPRQREHFPTEAVAAEVSADRRDLVRGQVRVLDDDKVVCGGAGRPQLPLHPGESPTADENSAAVR